MGARHPLPYAYAKAHTLLLEDDGERLMLWAPENVSLSALGEVLRLFSVDTLEHESASTLANRIAAAYAGGESSAATVIGEVESRVDLSRMMQDLPAVEDLLEAANDAPIIRMLNALLTQAAKDGASDIHIEPYERSSSVRFRVDGTLREVVQPNKALHAALAKRVEFTLADTHGVVEASVKPFAAVFPQFAGADEPEAMLHGDVARSRWLGRARVLGVEKNKTPQKAAQLIVDAFETANLQERLILLRRAFFVAGEDRLTAHLAKFPTAQEAEPELQALCAELERAADRAGNASHETQAGQRLTLGEFRQARAVHTGFGIHDRTAGRFQNRLSRRRVPFAGRAEAGRRDPVHRPGGERRRDLRPRQQGRPAQPADRSRHPSGG